MMQVDVDRAARTVVETCMRVAPGELIQIRGDAVAFDFIERLAFHVQRAGAHPFVKRTTAGASGSSPRPSSPSFRRTRRPSSSG